MTTLEIGLEILNTLRARPLMYCYTKEAALMRVTTVLEMLGISFTISEFSEDLLQHSSTSSVLQELTEEPDLLWVDALVIKAWEVIRVATGSVDPIG